MKNALLGFVRLPWSFGKGAVRIVGRLLQAVGSLAVSAATGAALGALLGLISGDPHQGMAVGSIVGAVLGLLCFAAAIYVPFGLRSFALWCLTGIVLPQCLFAVPVAFFMFLHGQGVNDLLALGLAVYVVLPAVFALLDISFPQQGLVARTVRGEGLRPYEELRREAARRLHRGRASGIWRQALRRHLARWGVGT